MNKFKFTFVFENLRLSVDWGFSKHSKSLWPIWKRKRNALTGEIL